jgi:hypothetical protein
MTFGLDYYSISLCSIRVNHRTSIDLENIKTEAIALTVNRTLKDKYKLNFGYLVSWP